MHEKQAGVGRFQVWALESRTRYALVWGGINAAILYSLHLLASPSEVSVGRALFLTALAVLAQGWIWYPRTKRKVSAYGSEEVRGVFCGVRGPNQEAPGRPQEGSDDKEPQRPKRKPKDA